MLPSANGGASTGPDRSLVLALNPTRAYVLAVSTIRCQLTQVSCQNLQVEETDRRVLGKKSPRGNDSDPFLLGLPS